MTKISEIAPATSVPFNPFQSCFERKSKLAPKPKKKEELKSNSGREEGAKSRRAVIRQGSGVTTYLPDNEVQDGSSGGASAPPQVFDRRF